MSWQLFPVHGSHYDPRITGPIIAVLAMTVVLIWGRARWRAIGANHTVAETTRDVFFYGLFMDEELLRAKGANPQAPRKAVVSGRRLRIGQRAMLVPDAAARAYGMVFALTDRELEALYAEPGLDLYTAERVVATYEDGTSRAVTTYNLAQAMATGPSNQEYAARLRSVLEHLGFPYDAAPTP